MPGIGEFRVQNRTGCGRRSEASSLQPGVATYRIVQEALTNVIKNARASRASVKVRIGEDLAIIVSDDGAGGDIDPGRGLTGIRERAAMHGGVVVFGPGGWGGFEVRCRLPLPEVA